MNKQNNLSERAVKKPTRILKITLSVFVAVSVVTIAYKAFAPDITGKVSETAIETEQTNKLTPTASAKSLGKKTAPSTTKSAAHYEKNAVVYYFYTNTRCLSCKLMEAYTKEAVEKNFSHDYKGWKVVFKGVNVEEKTNRAYIQTYWLDSKSVVVQTFYGDKPLNWVKLNKVWTLLGDKIAFTNYVTSEIQKLLEGK